MKITKEFAPVTIVIETAEELIEFRQIIAAGASHLMGGFGSKDTSLYEKAKLLLTDLKK